MTIAIARNVMTTDNRTNEPTVRQISDATFAFARSIEGKDADHESHDYYRKHVENALIASGLVASAKALERVEKFLDSVHGLNEMKVVRGARKAIAGEETTFRHEVKLNVYGAPCGHTPPSHYPDGYGKCQPCRYPDMYDEEDYDDETRW